MSQRISSRGRGRGLRRNVSASPAPGTENFVPELSKVEGQFSLSPVSVQQNGATQPGEEASSSLKQLSDFTVKDHVLNGTLPSQPLTKQQKVEYTFGNDAVDSRHSIEKITEDEVVLPLTTSRVDTWEDQLLERTSRGTLGKNIDIRVNLFEICVPEGNIYHYDVEISPDRNEALDYTKVTTAEVNREIVKELVNTYEKELKGIIPAYDGRKSLYTRKTFDFQMKTFRVVLDEGERSREYLVKLQFAATIDLKKLKDVFEGRSKKVPQDAVQALDVVIRTGPSFAHVSVGRSFFTNDGYSDPKSISRGRDLWFGYHTSVKLTKWKAMLNIDLTSTTFQKPGWLIELTREILADRKNDPLNVTPSTRLTERHISKLNKELRGVKVEVTHLPSPRRYKIKRVTKESAATISFTMEDGTEKNVAEYFSSRYKPLQFYNMPCIQCGGGKKTIYFPFEVCYVLPQQHSKTSPDDLQVSEIVKIAAVPPKERFKGINSLAKLCVQEGKRFLDEFDVQINLNPLQMKARVLPPPEIVYNRGHILPKDGSWDIGENEFFEAKSIETWVILHCAPIRFCSLTDVKKFVGQLKSCGRQLGMNIQNPQGIITCDSRQPVRDTLKQLKVDTPNLQLVLVVLAKKSTVYSELKSVAETEMGLITQCVLDFNVTKKCTPALVTNLLQKINSKMGGINGILPRDVCLSVFQTPVIIMGADVTHPAPSEASKPSIAAVVGSLNASASRYAVSIRVQTGASSTWKARVEVISDLKDMVKELLKAFYKATRHKPEKIIFLRDGVSEGQFVEVRNSEVTAIRQACEELSTSERYEPTLTFITVQKRHHTRFMPSNDRDGVGRPRNVPPGTTVDDVITHPVDFDFYLCSHFGIQGTSRPTHYYVLWDDSNYSADELQKLIYSLCHTYARCFRSVSIPIPVYYAHLAAFRAREHVNGKVDISSSSSESSATSEEPRNTSFLQEAVTVLNSMKTSMYFI